MIKEFMRKFKPLEILNEEQVEAIHRGTLNVIETTGVRVEHDRALALFAEHGCKVDFDNKRVRIPGWLVEESLRKCPSGFPVKTRDPESDLMIGGNTLYFAQEVGMHAVDLDTWESRTATLKEHNDAVRVMDALDTVAGLQAYQFYMDMEGVSPSMVYLEGLASGIRNTTKMQCFNHMNDSEIFAIKMAKAVGIDLLGGMTLSPPLTFFTDCCEAGLRFAEAEFPIPIIGGAVMGGTAPATFAGATVTNNVELIAGIVLLQLFKPGTKVLPVNFVYPMNMRNGNLDFGAMGIALHTAIFNQIWRSYGIPRGIMCGGYTSSKKIDFQNAYEKAMMNLIAAISGTNIAFFQGSIHGELTYHPVQAVLDDDIAGWIGHFLEGVEVTDETLAIKLINQIGPIPGNYLNTAHTRKWWKVHFVPKVADRESYPEWVKKGKKDALTLAKERLEEILATHKPKPLTPEQDEAINEILEEARIFYREKGML
jgi:trimethylamine--corrinoid protein Co-methyltransferase